VVLLLGVLAFGFSAGWFERRPSIVLITVDTQRPDRLGCYGHPTNQTPGIDALAAEGLVFEHAYCDVPWTTASMASVMTGKYSPYHGVTLPSSKLGQEAVTLAEVLHARGFQTAAIIGSFPLDAVYGLNQGFQVYDDTFTTPLIAVPDTTVTHVELSPDAPDLGESIMEKMKNDAFRKDEEVTDAALGWLGSRDPRTPFFLWVHYFGPHEKLTGDRSFTEQEPDMVAYDGDVEKTDHAVGRFLDRLRTEGIVDDTLVILHSDHGQNLGESDYVGHGIRLDEESVHIPLIMRYPRRVLPGSRRTDVVRNIDITPTVLDAVGAADPTLAGRSLLPPRWWKRLTTPLQVPGNAYFETRLPTIIFRPQVIPDLGTILGPLRRFGLRTYEWRYVASEVVGPCSSGTPERDGFGNWSIPEPVVLDPARCKAIRRYKLFHESDPAARDVDVAATQAPVAAALDGEARGHADHTPETAGNFALSPEQERKLRSLGYLQ